VGEPGPCSSTSEYRLALFNKGAARFAVIFRLTTMDVVGSLEVETIVHVSVHGAVSIRPLVRAPTNEAALAPDAPRRTVAPDRRQDDPR
jgi:hypothetical protein